MHIIVVMNEQKWTLQALNLAFALSRQTDADMTLIKMQPVTQPAYLGDAGAYPEISFKDHARIEAYIRLSKNYDVHMAFAPCQYINLNEAIADAAEQLDAQIVFATLPHSFIPFLRDWQLRRLENRLHKQGRILYTLDKKSTQADSPPIIITAAEK